MIQLLITDYKKLEYSNDKIHEYAEQVLQIEEVACKDWLTNKVDRSVTGQACKTAMCRTTSTSIK